jgi:hypothetical protein
MNNPDFSGIPLITVKDNLKCTIQGLRLAKICHRCSKYHQTGDSSALLN